MTDAEREQAERESMKVDLARDLQGVAAALHCLGETIETANERHGDFDLQGAREIALLLSSRVNTLAGEVQAI